MDTDCKECERLRAELASMKVAAESAIEYVAEREREECEKTRTELAAAKALLREVYEKACSAEIGLRDTSILQGSIYTLWDRIRAALGDEP